jgi:D-alanine-D-alanine ligase
VERVGNGRRLCAQLVAGRRWDLVFNIAEGVRGRSREAQVPGLLEMFDIPYTFSDPLVCSVTLDKGMAKRIIRDSGLETPAFAVVASPEDTGRIQLEYPLFVKPLSEGTSKGIDARSKVTDYSALQSVCEHLLNRHKQPVLVEEYLPGREFTAGIIGSGREARVIGIMEIMIRGSSPVADYSYEVKCDWERLVKYEPLAACALWTQIEDLALKAYRVLDCRDAARVDIRLNSKGIPSFVEINPLPGLNPVYSDLPILALQHDWSYSQLIGSIVDAARERVRQEMEAR